MAGLTLIIVHINIVHQVGDTNHLIMKTPHLEGT